MAKGSFRQLVKGIKLDPKAKSFRVSGSDAEGVGNPLSKLGYSTTAKSFRLSRGKVNLGQGGEDTTRSVNNTIQRSDGDIILVEASRFNVQKPVQKSVINIYNPRRVNVTGGGTETATTPASGETTSEDFTTQAEKKEEELEARRRRSMFSFFSRKDKDKDEKSDEEDGLWLLSTPLSSVLDNLPLRASQSRGPGSRSRTRGRVVAVSERSSWWCGIIF